MMFKIRKKKEHYQKSPDYRVLALLEATRKSIADLKPKPAHHKENHILNAGMVAAATDNCTSNDAKSTDIDDLLGLDDFFKRLKERNNGS